MTSRILLIDDDLLLGHLIRSLVTSRGGDVTQVLNGKAGLEMAMQEAYDHILVDLMLPQIDGLNVLRSLSAPQQIGKKPKLTAISGRRQPEHQQECMDAGADQFLEKPVRAQALLSCLGL